MLMYPLNYYTKFYFTSVPQKQTFFRYIFKQHGAFRSYVFMEQSICFTGGGTAGHVFPGLAVIQVLQKKAPYTVFWIGSGRGMEKKIVEAAGIPFVGIPAGKLRRYFSIKNLIDLFKVGFGFLKALSVFAKRRPLAVFSKGGYVTVPPVFAAKLLKIPVISHESDFDPGLATRLASKTACKICVSYPETREYFPQNIRMKVIATGNPVREEITNGDAAKGRQIIGCRDDLPVILVLGGSLGSKIVNDLIDSVRERLCSRAFLVHQTGEKHFATTRRSPDSSTAAGPYSSRYFRQAFFTHELPHILAAATLVVARAGANTLWELAAAGKPSILIPLGTSGSRGDQLRNAAVFGNIGASIVFEEQTVTPDKFCDALFPLLADNARLSGMAGKAKSVFVADARERIVKVITDTINSIKEA